MDNLIKISQDLIFKCLINDAHVVQLSACKLPTQGDAYIVATLEIVSLPNSISGDVNELDYVD